MRSALTMLGVFIGVAALIAMVAVGQGANEAVRKQIESLGTNLLVVVPGAVTTGGMRAGSAAPRRSRSRTRRRSAAKTPAVGRSAISSARPGRSNTATRTGPRPSRASAPTIRRSPTGRSRRTRHHARTTTASAALVVVIGQTVYRQLFSADENPIGAVIQVKGMPLRVIGVLAAKGQTPIGTGPGRSRDDPVHAPPSARCSASPRRASSRRRSTGSIRHRPTPTTCSRG